MNGFFKSILSFVLLLWAGAKAFIKENAAPAVNLLEALKAFVGSDAVDWAVVKTKTGLDDIALSKLKGFLVGAINILNLSADCMGKQTDNERIICYLNYIASLQPQHRNALLLKTASIIASSMDSKKSFKEFAVDFFIQLAYSQLKK